MGKTSIEWTDATWNPVRGCSRVSPGCRECYAERTTARNLPGMRSPTTNEPFAIMTDHGPSWTGKVELIESKLTEPLHWRKPRRVFVNSMSDLFHEKLSDLKIYRVLAIIAACRKHTMQVLTKRADRLPVFFGNPNIRAEIRAAVWDLYDEGRMDRWAAEDASKSLMGWWPLPNLWLGVSVEDRDRKDRIELLRQTPAAVRFLSIEPLLEDIGELDLSGIHWVIVGGESGPNARPCDLAWIRSIVAQCKAASVACFVKQVGKRPREHGFGYTCENDNSKGGDPMDWPREIRVRELPEARHA